MTTLWFILGQDWFDCLLHTSFIKILNLRFKKVICRCISISSSYLVLVCPSLISNSYKGLCRARSIHSSAILSQLVCVLLCFYLLFVLVLGDWWRSWSWIGSRSKVTSVKRNRLFCNTNYVLITPPGASIAISTFYWSPTTQQLFQITPLLKNIILQRHRCCSTLQHYQWHSITKLATLRQLWDNFGTTLIQLWYNCKTILVNFVTILR